jgi:hypothetical protein
MALSKASVTRVKAKVIGQPGRNMLNMFGDGKSAPKGPSRDGVKGGSKTGFAASGKDSSMPKVTKSPKRMSASSNTVTNTKRNNKGSNAGPQLPANKKQNSAAGKGIGKKSID